MLAISTKRRSPSTSIKTASIAPVLTKNPSVLNDMMAAQTTTKTMNTLSSRPCFGALIEGARQTRISWRTETSSRGMPHSNGMSRGLLSMNSLSSIPCVRNRNAAATSIITKAIARGPRRSFLPQAAKTHSARASNSAPTPTIVASPFMLLREEASSSISRTPTFKKGPCFAEKQGPTDSFAR